jgi:hypothetical protein
LEEAEEIERRKNDQYERWAKREQSIETEEQVSNDSSVFELI